MFHSVSAVAVENSQTGHLRLAKCNFLYMRKHPHADLIAHTHSPPFPRSRQGGLGGEGGESERVLGEKQELSDQNQPRAGLLQQQEVSKGPCRACAVSRTGSLCGKSAEATTKRITETRDQEQQAPSPLYSCGRLHTALLPQAALLARALPHPRRVAGIRESGNQTCCWRGRRGEEREQLESKQRSA